ncbi:putative non-specific serine/threonine protein kinase [Helianthus annuus]|uniref:Non-specific serine/threonine protein kinase n=1 Tax=Helianthus annuus TaxID=4232 RepID=A0A9K3IT13_HELAN|nr:putative non-specific serine/threonine protein kinase [Helianthus annuus]KAF5802443.1 putative non-specific serine/threonine protein kinase [Helianthus annuus]KAJ0527486.1 putative non-specific serine/threonine protein kinase [Helianthus annuus]KAJ0536216.1 putative non-specific serine/threonine protein kinase [Helianthus annuus]KAJ0543895.1 putative non-specific serine/threonine protein kinase [Helianthus annuus]
MEKKCEPLKEVGSANFRAARLVKDKTKELFAVKYIKRQSKEMSENVRL